MVPNMANIGLDYPIERFYEVKFKIFCFFSMVNVIAMWKESIMNPKKVIRCFGIISDLFILM